MRRRLLSIFVILCGTLLFPVFFATATLDFPFAEGDTILTQDQNNVIWKDVADSDNVLRDGTKVVAEWLGDTADGDGIYYEEITDTQEAWTEFTRTWKWIVNWTLWIAWLAALVYLLYHWFLAITAWWDDEKLKKWIWWIKFALIAVFGIAIAWFGISIIFWLIRLLVW